MLKYRETPLITSRLMQLALCYKCYIVSWLWLLLVMPLNGHMQKQCKQFTEFSATYMITLLLIIISLLCSFVQSISLYYYKIITLILLLSFMHILFLVIAKQFVVDCFFLCCFAVFVLLRYCQISICSDWLNFIFLFTSIMYVNLDLFISG